MRWMLPAIALSLGLHAGLLGVLGSRDAEVPGSDAMVTGTVIVFDTPPALAVSAADGSDQDASPAAGSATPVYGPEDPLAPPPEQVAEDQPEPQLEPEPEAATQPVATAEPEPVPAPQTTVQAAEEPADPIQTATVPLPRPKPPLPAHIAERLATEKAEAEAQRRAAANKKKAEEKRRKQDKQAAARNRQKAAKPARTANTGKPAAASRQGSAGRSGGASAGQKRAYASRVLSHIQRFKRYPSGTSATGVVRLAVRISGSGSISGASVRKSSGNTVLDRAAVATARAAAPYPAPPGGAAFSFTVSLRYTR